MHLSAGLALALRRMDHAVNLLAELVPTLSSRSGKVPHGQSLANTRTGTGIDILEKL